MNVNRPSVISRPQCQWCRWEVRSVSGGEQRKNSLAAQGDESSSSNPLFLQQFHILTRDSQARAFCFMLCLHGNDTAKMLQRICNNAVKPARWLSHELSYDSNVFKHTLVKLNNAFRHNYYWGPLRKDFRHSGIRVIDDTQSQRNCKDHITANQNPKVTSKRLPMSLYVLLKKTGEKKKKLREAKRQKFAKQQTVGDRQQCAVGDLSKFII